MEPTTKDENIREQAERAWRERLSAPVRSLEAASHACRDARRLRDRAARAMALLTMAYRHLQLADWVIAEQELATALGGFAISADDRGTALGEMLRAQLHLAEDDFEGARQALEKALRLEVHLHADERLELRVRMAAWHRMVGRIEDVFVHFSQAGADDIDNNSLDLILVGLAELLMRVRDFKGALVELDAVADGGRRTASTLVHGSRIACHLRLGDREQARMLALQLLQLNPATRSAGDGNYAFAVAVIALAGVHLLPDAEQALAIAREIADKSPRNERSRVQRLIAEAAICLARGQHADVVTLLAPICQRLPAGLPREMASFALESVEAAHTALGNGDAAAECARQLEASNTERRPGYIVAKVVGAIRSVARVPSPLTRAEAECLAAAAAGIKERVIAVTLNRSLSTVQKQLASARVKLCARNTKQALVMAIAAGYIAEPAADPPQELPPRTATGNT